MKKLLLFLFLLLNAADTLFALTVTANFTSANTIPVTAASYTATGNDVSLTLAFAPPTGTSLSVVRNTGLGFIIGRFTNLAQGQKVNLTYNGKTYPFLVSYYGGTGNDLVLYWAYQDAYSWGGNSGGQLGTGGTSDSDVPVLVTNTGSLSGKTVTSVTAGSYSSSSLAFCSDGTLVAWGSNYYGQLGNGTTTDSSVPVLVTKTGALSGKTVTAVASSGRHSLALCSDGTVAAWGYNSSGQLGNGTTSNSSVPVIVTKTGVLSGKTVTSVAAGVEHSLAFCSDGTLVAWGSNSSGQLGNGTTTNSSFPVLVTKTGVLSGKTVTAIASGGRHSLALCSDGTLAAWGYNSSGTLGNGTTTSSGVPVLVTNTGALSGKTVISVAAGSDHSLALCSDGTVAAWGYNPYGQLGNGTATNSSVPVLVTKTGVLSGKTVTSVAAGTDHSLALCSDGTVAAWGYNDSGQLGIVTTMTSSVPMKVTKTGALYGKTVISVSAGGAHSLALCSDGTLVAWGSNLVGELGNGTTTSSGVPVLVTNTGALSGKTVISVAAGSHSLALCSDGTVAAWGDNSSGQLGNGTTTNSSVPVLVTKTGVLSGKTVISVAAGGNRSLALCSDGRVVAWGAGPLGDATWSYSNVPVLVTNTGALSGKTVISVSTGSNHSLALCSDGTVAAWGYNSSGQLGNGTTTESIVPVLVTKTGVLSGKTVISVASGITHSLALCSDGTVAAWGNNDSGQLGNGTKTKSSAPVLVTNAGEFSGNYVIGVSAGVGHNIAIAASAFSNDSSLTALTINAGTLTPAFSSDNFIYTASVSTETTSLSVTPRSDFDATIQVRLNNGAFTTVASGSPSAALALSLGANTVDVKVTSQDLSTSTTYTTTVNRLNSPIMALAQGTTIANAGSKSFGLCPVGVGTSLIFTITNTGFIPLNMNSVSVAGGSEGDFSLDTNGMVASLPAISGTTTFGVTFNPTAAGNRSTTLRIVNDDPARNPYVITLSGTGISSTEDIDGDGLNDAAEFRMSALGFNWQSSQPALVSALFNNIGAAQTNLNAVGYFSPTQQSVLNAQGYFTASQVQALNIGVPLIQKNAGNGKFTLTIGLQKSTDLMQPNSFHPFFFTAPETTIDGQGRIQFQFTGPESAAFFRLQSQ